MRILPLLIYYISVMFTTQQTTSPHGKEFNISCSECHSSKGWILDKEIYSFNHSTTNMPLKGQHKQTDCKLCHKTLVFSEANSDCISCHNDVHQATTGSDCSRCHSPASWLVNNITSLHQVSRFPLVGAHRTADCFQCHKSESLARYDVPGIECIDCHRQNYVSTTTPNHASAGFSEDCSICHPVKSFQWTGAGFNHNFFALVQGHALPSCAECHTTGLYSDANPECVSCHQTDYNSTTNPRHQTLGFSTICTQCHTTNPDWKPASYREHDAKSFPIYSGKHRGEWTNCSECHTNTSNYSVFSCLNCHEHNKASMDSKHRGENGYSYDSASCLKCHPTGRAD